MLHQVLFILRIQGWSNIRKLTSVVCHTNRLKEENDIIVSKGTWQQWLSIQKRKFLEIKDLKLNMIKNVSVKLRVMIQILEIFFIKNRGQKEYLLLTLFTIFDGVKYAHKFLESQLGSRFSSPVQPSGDS